MSYGPTHQFCPNCSAMLPPQLAECPRCGHDLTGNAVDVSGKDILKITGGILLLAIVPFLLLIAAAVICVSAAR